MRTVCVAAGIKILPSRARLPQTGTPANTQTGKHPSLVFSAHCLSLSPVICRQTWLAYDGVVCVGIHPSSEKPAVFH